MKYSEYITNLLDVAQSNHARHLPIYLCNQVSDLPIDQRDYKHLAKYKLFTARLLNRQHKETGIHTTTLSPFAHKHFGVDYNTANITQKQQNEYRLYILQKYRNTVIHLEKLASSRKKAK